MCQPESIKRCEHPEKLKGKPEDCPPEQKMECHGVTVEHSCYGEAKKPSKPGKG